MNEFQSIQTGQGLLKDQYESTPIADALRKRSAKLSGKVKEEDDEMEKK